MPCSEKKQTIPENGGGLVRLIRLAASSLASRRATPFHKGKAGNGLILILRLIKSIEDLLDKRQPV
jgi:hypothetical protein